jgi:hypothetical protein
MACEGNNMGERQPDKKHSQQQLQALTRPPSCRIVMYTAPCMQAAGFLAVHGTCRVGL